MTHDDPDDVLGAVLAECEDLPPAEQIQVLLSAALAVSQREPELISWQTPAPEPVPSYVQIPGTFSAEYTPGAGITGYSFTPAASGAGYFGPSAVLLDGPEIDVDYCNSPFWNAVVADVQDSPSATPYTITVQWTE